MNCKFKVGDHVTNKLDTRFGTISEISFSDKKLPYCVTFQIHLMIMNGSLKMDYQQ